MKTAPAIELGEERRGLGPSQHEHCKHAGCQREVRMTWAGGYCLKHYLTHKDEIMAKTSYPDDQVRDAWERTHSINGVAAALGCAWGTANHNLSRLGLTGGRRAINGTPKKARPAAAQKPAATPAATPEVTPPPVRPAAPPRSTSTALAPVPAPGSMGSDGVLDQVEGIISAAQQIVAALRPLGDAARHQVLMLVGGAGVGLPARGEG